MCKISQDEQFKQKISYFRAEYSPAELTAKHKSFDVNSEYSWVLLVT
jgi:hypothetical protein